MGKTTIQVLKAKLVEQQTIIQSLEEQVKQLQHQVNCDRSLKQEAAAELTQLLHENAHLSRAKVALHQTLNFLKSVVEGVDVRESRGDESKVPRVHDEEKKVCGDDESVLKWDMRSVSAPLMQEGAQSTRKSANVETKVSNVRTSSKRKKKSDKVSPLTIDNEMKKQRKDKAHEDNIVKQKKSYKTR